MFYNYQNAKGEVINYEYDFVQNPNHMYELMKQVWCKESCAPRMQKDWTEDNMTLGQCSITSFLAQDIFGGEVYGVPLPEGGYHCFNCVDGIDFDLTSEQFNHPLVFTHNYPQSREEHFASEEKYQRYLLIKNKLKSLK